MIVAKPKINGQESRQTFNGSKVVAAVNGKPLNGLLILGDSQFLENLQGRVEACLLADAYLLEASRAVLVSTMMMSMIQYLKRMHMIREANYCQFVLTDEMFCIKMSIIECNRLMHGTFAIRS